MRMFVRNPVICGMRPGWADTSWSMLIQSPGSVSDSLRMVLGALLVLQGFRWDIPKTQDMHIGMRFLSFESFLGILFDSAILIRIGNGAWFILQCNSINSFWSSSRISGLAICWSSLAVRFGSSDAYCSIVIGTLEMSGWSSDLNMTPSTRSSLSSDVLIWCLRPFSLSEGPMYETTLCSPFPLLNVTDSSAMNSMLSHSISSSLYGTIDDPKDAWGGIGDPTSRQKLLNAWNPSSNRSSGRPETGVGNVFVYFPKHHVSLCVEYLELIAVSSSGFPSLSRNFSASRRVDRRLTGDSGR